MICLYFSGIVLSVLLALILKNTAFRGNPVPFVMELPNYRIPSPKSVALLLWEKAKDFLQRAFTVIFVATIIIWFLQSFDTRINPVEDSADSILAAIGRFIAPIFKPLGFADWRVATALISGFTAKEAVVSTMSVLLNTSISSLGGALSSLFTPLTGRKLPRVHSALYALRRRSCNHKARDELDPCNDRHSHSSVRCRVARRVRRLSDREPDSMKPVDFVVIAVIVLLVVLAIISIRRRKSAADARAAPDAPGCCSQCEKNKDK